MGTFHVDNVKKSADDGTAGFVYVMGGCIAVLYFTRQPRIPLLAAFTLYHLGTIVFTSGLVLTAMWRRVAIRQVGLFFGPPLFTFQIGDVPVRVSAIPVGCFVSYYARDGRPGYADDIVRAGLRRFDELRTWEQLLICLGGSLGLLATAVVLRGPVLAAESFVHGFVQLTRITLSPSHAGPELLSPFLRLVASGSILHALFSVATKVRRSHCFR